jgi:vacuolar protein 8
LLKLLDEGTPDAKEHAAGAVWDLANNEDNKVTLMELGSAPKLLKLLDEGTPGAKEQAAGAVGDLAVNEDNKVALMKLGAALQIIEATGLARLVRKNKLQVRSGASRPIKTIR